MHEPEHPARNKRSAQAWEPWRDDHLGRRLHEGLAPLRSAQPSEDAWAHVAAQIAADAPLAQRLPRGMAKALALVLGRDALRLPAREVRVRATGLLAAMAMVAVSIASVGVIRSGAKTFSGALYAAQPLVGLTAPEVAIQPEINPRPLARALPGGVLSEAVLRALRGVRAQRAQRLLDQNERTLGLPRGCMEAFDDAYGLPFHMACHQVPAVYHPAWVGLTDPPQSL